MPADLIVAARTSGEQGPGWRAARKLLRFAGHCKGFTDLARRAERFRHEHHVALRAAREQDLRRQVRRIDVDGVHDVLEIRTSCDLESVGRSLENCLANDTGAGYHDELKTGVTEFWAIRRSGAVIGVLPVNADTRAVVRCLGARNEPVPVDRRTRDAIRHSVDAAPDARERSLKALRSVLNVLCQTRKIGTGRVRPAGGSGRTFGTRPTAILKWTPLWPMVNIGEALVDNVFREGVSPEIGSVVHCDRAFGYRKRTSIRVGDKRVLTVSGDGRMTLLASAQFIDGGTAVSIYVSCSGNQPVGGVEVVRHALELMDTSPELASRLTNCHDFTVGCLTGDFHDADGSMSSVEEAAVRALGADTWHGWDLETSTREASRAEPPVRRRRRHVRQSSRSSTAGIRWAVSPAQPVRVARHLTGKISHHQPKEKTMPVPFVPIAIPVAAALGAGVLGYIVGRAASESESAAIDYDDLEDEVEESPGGMFGIHSETGEDAGLRWTDMSRADALEILELAPDATCWFSDYRSA